MSDTVAVLPVEPSLNRRTTRGWLRRQWKAVVAALIVATLVITGAVLVARRDNAHVFNDSGATVGQLRLNVGRTYYAMTLAESGSAKVDLRLVAPVVGVNTAHATIQLLVCERNSSPSTIGAAGRHASCRALHRFTPGSIQLNGDQNRGKDLVLAITPHRPGRLTIHGLYVLYQQGWWRTGAQYSGLDMVYRFH